MKTLIERLMTHPVAWSGPDPDTLTMGALRAILADLDAKAGKR